MSDKKEHTNVMLELAGGDNASVEINLGATTFNINRHEKNTGEYVISRDEMEANAARIVESWNSHSRLVQENEELKETILDLQNNAEVREELLEEMRNALGMLENKVPEGMLTLKEEKLLEKLRIQ